MAAPAITKPLLERFWDTVSFVKIFNTVSMSVWPWVILDTSTFKAELVLRLPKGGSLPTSAVFQVNCSTGGQDSRYAAGHGYTIVIKLKYMAESVPRVKNV